MFIEDSKTPGGSEKQKNYREALLEAMQASSEERKKEKAARQINGRGLFIAVIAIIAIVAIIMLLAS